MTPVETPEHVFQRYQQTADPAELAKVFDKTAPQLLLLASHVSADGAAAEDLVQETFLVAMEKAEQWDPERPLLPWLGGILRHRAQDLARRLGLRRPAAELSDVYVAAEGVGPLGEAEGTELLQRVQDALGTLPSPFREALVLRLVHGLQPTEIAHALGRPPATVRGQLKRGLETLRGALPVGLASALALLLLPGKGMAATRQAVLAVAYDGAAVKAAASSGTREALSVARHGAWLAAVALTIAVLVGGYFLFFDSPVVTPPSGTVVAAESSVEDSAETGQVAAIADEPGRRDVTIVTRDPDAPNMTTLRGRCVRATDGGPVQAATATVTFGRGRFVTEDPEYHNWPAPITVQADARGEFAVSFATEPLLRVSLTVSAPGHTESDESWPSLQAGIDIDLGDVALIPGCIWAGRVVDADGKPVPSVLLEIERRSGGVASAAFTMWSFIQRESGADGRLGEEVLPLPGHYGISVSHTRPGYRVVSPTELVLGAEARLSTAIVVARTELLDSVVGKVVDERGEPVAGLQICLHEELVQIGHATSADDGSFWLSAENWAREQELFLAPSELRYRMAEPTKKYERGAPNVEVRVVRQRSIDVPVEVVDARTGKPVESYGISHALDYWIDERKFLIPPDRFYRPVEPARHANGRTVLSVLPGKHRLMVFPEDKILATAYMLPFTVTESGADPVRVELHGHAEARVRLRDETGKPLEGVTVRLFHSMSGAQFAALFSTEELARGVGGGRKMAVALHTQVTDKEGRVVLRAPVSEARLGLQLSGPRVVWTTQKMAQVPVDGLDWDITLPALATVRGTVGPASLLERIGPSAQERLWASMVRPEDSDLNYACAVVMLQGKGSKFGGRAPLLPDGTFAIETAYPGDYELMLVDDCVGTVPLTSVPALTAGEVREVEADGSQHVPARMRGVVVLDGAPWARGELGMLQMSANKQPTRIGLGGRGDFDAVLRPMKYLPYLNWEDDDGDHYLFSRERVELAQGADAQLRLGFEHRVLRVEVLRADDTPADDEIVFAHAVDYPETHRWLRDRFRTNELGVYIYDPAPPGRIELRVPNENGTVIAIVATDANKVTTVRVQLPH